MKIFRPNNFEEFIGNKPIVDQLKIAISAARKENRSLGHILLFGNPGVGKTSLAHVIANELGIELMVTVGASLRVIEDIARILLSLQAYENPILMIDEIHNLAEVDVPQEVWFSVLDDFIFHHNLENKVLECQGEKYLVKANACSLKPFTLIGTTTDPGLLSAPLRDRFIYDFRLQEYSLEDLSQILKQYASKANFCISSEAILQIAKRGRGNPRRSIAALIALNDRRLFFDKQAIDEQLAQDHFVVLGIDELGLTKDDYKILFLLADQPKGLGLQTISQMIGINQVTIKELMEPYLKFLGLIIVTHNRKITNEGLKLLGKLAEEKRA